MTLANLVLAASEATASGITGNLNVVFAALASAIGVGLIGAKAAEAVGRNPGAFVNILIISVLGMALAEGIIFITIFLGRFAG
ncbi:MAG: ATPase [Verrucomicrobiota bacterium]